MFHGEGEEERVGKQREARICSEKQVPPTDSRSQTLWVHYIIWAVAKYRTWILLFAENKPAVSLAGSLLDAPSAY